jgi:ubiquinone/menaquinone biosynthesis C-methylase UbiE
LDRLAWRQDLLGTGALASVNEPLARAPGHESLDNEQVAEAFERVSAYPPMWLLRAYVVRKALALTTSGEAADLGCGGGRLAVDLARRCPKLRVTGIDRSTRMIELARARAAGAGLTSRTVFREADACSLPFIDGSVDLIVSSLSLHHWSRPLAALDGICRVLRRPDPLRGRLGGAFVLFDLRRDLALPSRLLLSFATHVVVPSVLRSIGEPLASSRAAYTPDEAIDLASRSRLTGWRVTSGPFWLTIEGRITSSACGVAAEVVPSRRPMRPAALAQGLD